MIPALVVLLGSALATGCISGAPPEVEVRDVQVTAVGEAGAALAVTLELTNTNDVALPLPRASYTLRVEGAREQYASKDLPSRVIPPALTTGEAQAPGVQTIQLPAVVAVDGSRLSGRRWEVKGSVTYQPDNGVRNFLTESGVPLPVVFFSGEGVLP